MELERNEKVTPIAGEVDERGHPLDEHTAHWYGLGRVRFRDMVMDLLIRGLVVGHMDEGGDYIRYDHTIDDERYVITTRLVQGRSIGVWLSHSGRIHLWNQRDALLRDPDLEPFGLRSRAAWDRDLFLRLQFATQQAPLSLMFLDLDNFGRVNKEHGAPVGDKVLRLVFGLVNSVAGTRGAAYRYGGEEVGVLLPGIELAEAAALAEDLRALIERDVHVQAPQLGGPQTASIGVAMFTGPMENDPAVAHVDELMRRAKGAGKNRVVIDDGAGATEHRS